MKVVDQDHSKDYREDEHDLVCEKLDVNIRIPASKEAVFSEGEKQVVFF